MFEKLTKAKKIFIIGCNKTGTTSMERILIDNGIKVGHQQKAERLIDAWIQRDFNKIISYCKNAEAFQDVPFSLPYTYMFLHTHYPNAKFILTIRDSAEQWYNSITKFHTKVYGQGRIPTFEDLKESNNNYKGWAYNVHKAMFNTPDNDLYNKKQLIQFYNNHNTNVVNFFSTLENKLLVINISKKDSIKDLERFLNLKFKNTSFPWENKTIEE